MRKDLSFHGVHLTNKATGSLWDVQCRGGRITSIRECHKNLDTIYDGRLLTSSFCHPHIHLDKCFLLSHPKYLDLEIKEGDFAEAMDLTNKAKSRFEIDDLLERGRALIEESLAYGVTHMRAFVEVDQTVGTKCLDAGLRLKEEFKTKCYIQICAFAQDPIYSQNDSGKEMLRLMENSASRDGVDVIGSTPYVEESVANLQANIECMIAIALKYSLHLDFHLDYNLDATIEPSVYYVIQELRRARWSKHRAVTLGHCTRLTLFTAAEWQELGEKIGELPISFVGLPTSDVFMMGRPDNGAGGGVRFRGTLQVPEMIKRYGLQAAIGVNNVGNAFTPHGSCDPLSVASLGVGIYQAGTKMDAEILLQCISSRARAAIGLGLKTDLEIEEGNPADLVAFGATPNSDTRPIGFRRRKTTTELVYDSCHERMTVFGGIVVSSQ